MFLGKSLGISTLISEYANLIIIKTKKHTSTKLQITQLHKCNKCFEEYCIENNNYNFKTYELNNNRNWKVHLHKITNYAFQ